jgi:tetratricopeptide (TPR) repeat protein
MTSMLGRLAAFVLAVSLAAAAQQRDKAADARKADHASGSHQDPQKESGQAATTSSSKETRPDLSPPRDDDKNHPDSSAAVREAEDAAGLYEGDEIGGIQEFKPWNPHKAQKDVEVGDYYFKLKNYRAALDRYREALYYKDNDAVATFRIAVCQEKLGDFTEARQAYGAYLKILPHGPFAGEARQALDRLKSENAGPDSSPDARAPR